MIDLRSDTLTLPGREMLSCILDKSFGDSGRLNADGRGDDPCVNELEDYAAALTGKERAVFLPSGTMGNHVALLTRCRPGDVVLMDAGQHIYRTEKATCDPRFGQIRPIFYHLTKDGYPDTAEIAAILKTQRPKLLCIENTHNGAGGTCIPVSVMAELRALADESGIPIHMDGARLFNAATALGVEAKELCRFADTVMFCISKGLGAPIGSLLCGTRDFCLEASATRKLLGGNMRQAGVVAAMGLYALRHNIPDLAEDHRRAGIAHDALAGLRHFRIGSAQTNILIIDIEGLGISVEDFIERAKALGLWLSKSTDTHARMVFYRDITDQQLYQAIDIMKALDQTFD
ncbi:threonine aldolase family protein [Dysosmobacter sp.]|uniref:threonine aldolase family protein n=1 Tax=Dysosmobacter sp. TaxID=2591382 RepID=UPI002A8A2D9E|nr:GntG family PLP-dependent aldolase [Dysosmobacter sp.]MDY3282481.1 GntG family PLP-dependent aldolase [Dysosmobacter sp.]